MKISFKTKQFNHCRPILGLILSVCSLVTFQSEAQDNNKSLPEQIVPLTSQYKLENPSAMPENYVATAFIAYAGYSSFRRDVSNFYGTGTILLNHNTNHKQTLGLSFYQDTDGKLIRQSQTLFNYGYEIFHQNGYSLSSGIGLGVYNAVIESTNRTAGTSDLNMDGKLGFTLTKKEEFEVSLFAGHIFKNNIVKFMSNEILARHYVLAIEKTWHINESFNLRSIGRYRLAENTQNSGDINLNIQYLETIAAGVNWNPTRGLDVSLSSGKLDIGKHALDISMNFNLVQPASVLGTSKSFEIFIKVYLKQLNTSTDEY